MKTPKQLPAGFLAKRWRPGQSGNPLGRRPGSKNPSTLLRELAGRVPDTLPWLAEAIERCGLDPRKHAPLEALDLVLIGEAIGGNMQAMKLILDRLDPTGPGQPGEAGGFSVVMLRGSETDRADQGDGPC